MYSKVMIIDDNAIDRYIAETVIKKSAFSEDVISKESAMSALDYLIEMADTPDALPELIFLDINMPEMNGFDFLNEFINLPAPAKSCNIMMLSSSLDPEDHKIISTNKFVTKFINKPLNKEKLQLLQLDAC